MKKQVVEFGGEAVGALVPENGKLRFIAVKYSVWSLDGMLYPSLAAAGDAVDTVLSQSKARAAAMPLASFWVPQQGDAGESQFIWNASSAIGDGKDQPSAA
ncbi:hypothetical protein P6U16_06640 [Rhizobium sp. 32-5/1]|uniref:hypothetical protein n=1 Tax=Rhizobium sp. 32-5/1 TaxID=3019602 RepID=UPI00240D60B8|nr:hypothetical protein [Rhizobium sp. 32-5/1]WEZ84319.1 hypothetical protein P6U16_06640 [Rhizobium sp. 32-5/1]